MNFALRLVYLVLLIVGVYLCWFSWLQVELTAGWQLVSNTTMVAIGSSVFLMSSLFTVYIKKDARSSDRFYSANEKLAETLIPFVLLLVLPVTHITSLLQWPDAFTDRIQVKGTKVDLRPSYIDIYTAVAFDVATAGRCDEFKTIYISGPGGRNDVANYLIARAKQCGIEEVVAYGHKCASSCTGIWAAFDKRDIEPNTEMGFHLSSSLIGDFPEEIGYWYKGVFPQQAIDAFSRISSDYGCYLKRDYVMYLTSKQAFDGSDITPRDILNKCRWERV